MNATALVNPSVQLADGAAVIRSAREPRPAAGADEIFSASLAAQQQAMAASSSEPADGAPSPPHAVKPGKAKALKQDGAPERDDAPLTATALPQGQAAAPQDPANAEAADAGESASTPQTGTVTGAMTGTQVGQPLPETGKGLPLTLPPLPAADNAELSTPASGTASGIAMNRAQASAPISPTPKSTAPASLDSATDKSPPKVGDMLAALLGDVKPQAAPTSSAAAQGAPPTASVTPASASPKVVAPSVVAPSVVAPSVVAPSVVAPSVVAPSVETATGSETSTQVTADAPFLRVSLDMGGKVVSGASQGKSPEPSPLSSQTGLSQAGGAHGKAQPVEGLVLSGLTLRVSEAQQSSGKEGTAGDPVLQNVAEIDRPAALGAAAPGPESAGPTAIMPSGAVPEPRPAAVVSAAQPAISVPLNQESWDKALGQHMLGMLQRDVQHAELHLRPPELGSLEVRIALSQDQASVTFTSAHGAVREALEAAVPRLRQMFAETGINLVDVNVSQHSFAQHSQREQGGLASYAASPAPASLPDAGVASAATVSPSRLVDYYA